MYNTYVKPVLTYNSSAWAVNKNIEAKIDASQRKQLKRVTGIYYPHRISNKELYKYGNFKTLEKCLKRFSFDVHINLYTFFI